jgi:hypothetical protein
MATQVRCPRCGHLFAGGEVRHLRASRSFVSPVAALLLALALVAWLLY